MEKFNSIDNYNKTKKLVNYVTLAEASDKVYSDLGFKSGLEIHQQLKTEKKLFCRCPAGIYNRERIFDAEIIRHMRPTLSELGEYDGTALMEFKTKKEIVYKINNKTTCTYEIDDTPPFKINLNALDIAIIIAKLLKTNIVGELHITRKQYLDGSIPTGFQRTAIVGIEGEIPLEKKTIRIIQLSIEEDSCREISDFRHRRVFSTDRLGMPLIEIVTYPDMITPQEVFDTGQYLRFLTRSTSLVRYGIGAAREDVNVSIEGGTRVEIKGVAHIKWFKTLVHNEAFRQKALLLIKERLKGVNKKEWKVYYKELDQDVVTSLKLMKFFNFDYYKDSKIKVIALNIPKFKGILSFFTQVGFTFLNEISDRLKVVACLEKPNILSSEDIAVKIDFNKIKKILKFDNEDAQIIFISPEEDVKCAIETVEERCLLATEGVPNETRKAINANYTIFERVLPGPDRMYPDTDSAPLPIEDEKINKLTQDLPIPVYKRYSQLKSWKVPKGAYIYLLKNNLLPLIEKIYSELNYDRKYISLLFAYTLKPIEGRMEPSSEFSYNRVFDLLKYVKDKNIEKDILPKVLKEVYLQPKMEFDSIFNSIDFKKYSEDEILSNVPILNNEFRKISYYNKDTLSTKYINAKTRWIMGQLKNIAIGNIPLKELFNYVKNYD